MAKKSKAYPVKKSQANKKTDKKNSKNKNEQSEVTPVIPWIIGIVAVFAEFCFIVPSATGVVGRLLKNTFCGLFSVGAYIIPVFILLILFKQNKDRENGFLAKRIILCSMSAISLSVLFHTVNGVDRCFEISVLFNQGKIIRGGGVIGGVIAGALEVLIDKAWTTIVGIILLLFCTLWSFGVTPRKFGADVSSYVHDVGDKLSEKKQSRVTYENKPNAYLPDEAVDIEPDGNSDAGPVIDEFDEEAFDRSFETEDYDDSESDIVPETVNTELGKKKFPDTEGVVDLNAILSSEEDFENFADGFADGKKQDESGLAGEKHDLVENSIDKTPDKAEEKPQKPEYVFPPTKLLNKEKSTLRTDTPEQLKLTAQKLVDTLASFRVKTHLVNISRGPTITRYELAPEEGVRVRSIANLVDDISLSLASSGVRIEAPIPGKSAVGIEVPNKNVATVYLRDLIENEQFRNNKSRVNVSLGMDVAGKPIYVDIAKMPHLLIAGATGMGKSVCINSMIVSLLYKASPDEVKLILIDPKKVELNIYNSLPHLLVPVVSDPKKAAGSLQWAVKEMERRFELIENEGVRDIYNYNMQTKDDPTIEFLPHIVIIIDELADLMMTAPENVESSICRLAQKARAAGMHLVIGTQRPSVDVITGLIKANIPSRIAFTVASQVDSRTIIDISGAEKLIGRGDMLYSPVGSSKPIRVQGAFVSESEVEAVTQFIREESGKIEYNSEVLENIEREAERCVIKKVVGENAEVSETSADEDPLIGEAIKLAVESGKISTSLIQRRLSVGYGRAAKLIDQMEQRGIVGPPDGNKPREILISKEAYLEMTVSGKD